MELLIEAKVMKGVGGIYEIRIGSEDAAKLSELGIEPERGDRLLCKAKGAFRHERTILLPGDNVRCGSTSALPPPTGKRKAGSHATRREPEF